jgi:organic hydroperoxide reductase OsmC/OhrA
MKTHHYATHLSWTGNTGEGTATYKSYRRDFTVASNAKPPIAGSSDPAFRGDPGRYNPEELLVASLSSCHMLWYLHLCSVNGIVVLSYSDDATGTMEENPDGSGQFTGVRLNPYVTVASSESESLQKAEALHEEAHHLCFIARSVNFPVTVVPLIIAATPSPPQASKSEGK